MGTINPGFFYLLVYVIDYAGSGLRLAAASSSVREFSSQMALTNNAVRAGVSGRSSVSVFWGIRPWPVTICMVRLWEGKPQ